MIGRQKSKLDVDVKNKNEFNRKKKTKMTSTRSDEEFLRELASLGDLNRIIILLDENVNLNVNSQNAMNGW